MKTLKTLWLAAIVAVGGAGSVLAADSGSGTAKGGTDVQQKIELHEKMAAMHKNFADCLRSGKAEADCRNQAMKECPMSKSGGCPFMGEMGRQGGRRRSHGMMRGQGATPSTETSPKGAAPGGPTTEQNVNQGPK